MLINNNKLEVIHSNEDDLYHFCKINIGAEDIVYGTDDTHSLYINIQYSVKPVAGTPDDRNSRTPKVKVNSAVTSKQGNIPIISVSPTTTSVQVYTDILPGEDIELTLIMLSSVTLDKVSTKLIPASSNVKGGWRNIPLRNIEVERSLVRLHATEVHDVPAYKLPTGDVNRVVSILFVGDQSITNIFVDIGKYSAIEIEEIINEDTELSDESYFVITIYYFVTAQDTENNKTDEVDITIYHDGNCNDIYSCVLRH